MEKGFDRSTVEPTDRMAAHYMSGWFAGVRMSGIESCLYASGTAIRAFWVGGYLAGVGERISTASEHAARHIRRLS
jgi:ribosome modulation factor